MSSSDPGAFVPPSDEDGITPADAFSSEVRDPMSETREVRAVRPALTPITPGGSGEKSSAASTGPGARFITIMIALALFFGALGGGVAGGIAGYALSDRNDDVLSVAEVAPSNQPEPISNEVTPAPELSVSDLVAQINPAVVTIENTMNSSGGFAGQGSGVATGSGFIIDTAGHIVTNNHVVEDAATLKVTFSDGTEASATLVGVDPYQDVAVIKVDVPVPATVAFGDSSGLRAGDPVLAIGSALGEFTNTVTNGIVSATDRSLDTGEGYRLGNLIQHNAPISPGNSGGPLVDMDGNVIGMNTAVVRGSMGASAEGLGFAVAGNTVKQIAEEIIAGGTAERPYVGITFTDAQALDADTNGVVIREVVEGSPAADAGLKPGDLITAIDGVAIDAEHPFLNLMFAYKPGDTVEFTVEHSDGQTEMVSVTLGTRPA